MNALENTIVNGLPDLCAEALAYGVSLRRARPGSAQQVRERVAALFAALGRDAGSYDIDSADVEEAKFALCAFLDELLISPALHWDGRDDWTLRPLQLDYFNLTTAGRDFFTRLDGLRGSGRSGAMEVYALCLGLGFKGQHAGVEGMDKIGGLIGGLIPEIRNARGVKGNLLSGECGVEHRLAEHVKQLPLWIIAAVCAGLVVMVAFGLHAMLASDVSELTGVGD